jgi:hypothetical protein
VVDARLLVTPQNRAHRRRHPLRARSRLAQQFREQLPHLGHRHRRRFSPPSRSRSVCKNLQKLVLGKTVRATGKVTQAPMDGGTAFQMAVTSSKDIEIVEAP